MAAFRSLLAIAALAIAPACDDDDGGIIIDDPVQDTADEGFARGNIIAGQAADELTGDEFTIVIGKTASILAAINDGEILQADFAVQVVNDDDIFDFANRMIIEHEDANFALDETVRFYGIGYIPSDTADQLAAEATDGLRQLQATPPPDVDFAYTEMQVIMHAEALVLLDELEFQVGPGAMADYIQDTRAMVENHFDEAQNLLDTFY